ncbi:MULTISPECIES: NAD(P)/FAD-dependent oxidoreductase [Thiorhodovibrio]|uniref:NAD(P)/FAD-dependent oxidoreductase n=1 Tax=Thiorhodovibrio TaxID=61593 RepID=UPI001913504B|nr:MULTISPECIES: FAD-dependent oxidoreductase [Thiorhodovibrio]MBK5969792.1 NAD/FAD-binding protein [Thiorhodovibrio winogradskyi]WPL12164.1 protoporphyrinogen oxidase [Thiorhodovibrio litoralis]
MPDQSAPTAKQEQIAVIGSGIAGLASAWLLAGRHQVTLIERNDYVGGHTHTIVVDDDGRPLPVDTGFIVYNEANYPLLVRLFERLGVATREGDMSFAASIRSSIESGTGSGLGAGAESDSGLDSGSGEIEYSGDSLKTLFAQPRNLLSPCFIGMLADIVRFNRRCRRCLERGGFDELSVGEFLKRERLGPVFRDHYLLPMAAAIWSCPTRTMMDFPIESLARFFKNHGLINILQRPLWRTVTGGSHAYVEKIIADIGRENVLHDPAVRVRRLTTDKPGGASGDSAGAMDGDGDQGVEVTLASGTARRFDQVVFACHADEALAMIQQPSADETRLLGCFRYQANQTWLHTDTRLMPRRRAVWSSWNYLATRAQDGQAAVSVTYWMNRLQGLETSTDYLVSLNPPEPPRPETRIAEMVYHHPVFDQRAMDAQQELHKLQGQGGLWFCGSYFGYGFHEDALRAAVDMAGRMGIDTAWLTDSSASGQPSSAAERR